MKLDSSIAAVVTGGASGLGEATVRQLAAHGVKVAIFDMNEAKGEEVAKDVGGVFCKCNVTSEEEVDAAFAKARAAHGQERILVNCAGTGNAAKTASRDKTTGETKHFPLDAFNLIIQINLVGTFRCIAKIGQGHAGRSSPLTVSAAPSSTPPPSAAEDGQMGQAAYSASKGGVVGMTLPIARDLAGDGIRVNTILPRHLRHTADARRARSRASRPWPIPCPSPSAWVARKTSTQLALTMITNGYFNGEDVRLDGAPSAWPRAKPQGQLSLKPSAPVRKAQGRFA